MSEKKGVLEECLYCHNNGTHGSCPVCGDAWFESKRPNAQPTKETLTSNPNPIPIPQIAGV
ncbi:MAG: hypothetical protein P8017_02900 [Deltaproteobacteria bacterium]|jgi:hypothetical protein